MNWNSKQNVKKNKQFQTCFLEMINNILQPVMYVPNRRGSRKKQHTFMDLGLVKDENSTNSAQSNLTVKQPTQAREMKVRQEWDGEKGQNQILLQLSLQRNIQFQPLYAMEAPIWETTVAVVDVSTSIRRDELKSRWVSFLELLSLSLTPMSAAWKEALAMLQRERRRISDRL